MGGSNHQKCCCGCLYTVQVELNWPDTTTIDDNNQVLEPFLIDETNGTDVSYGRQNTDSLFCRKPSAAVTWQFGFPTGNPPFTVPPPVYINSQGATGRPFPLDLIPMTGDIDLRTWYCWMCIGTGTEAPTPSTATITVANVGGTPICVNETTVAPGDSWVDAVPYHDRPGLDPFDTPYCLDSYDRGDPQNSDPGPPNYTGGLSISIKCGACI